MTGGVAEAQTHLECVPGSNLPANRLSEIALDAKNGNANCNVDKRKIRFQLSL